MRYWKRENEEGEITTVESYSLDCNIEGAIEIDKPEFDAYIASLPLTIPIPVRDLANEVDNLTMRVSTLESKG